MRFIPAIYLVVEVIAFIALGSWIGYGWALVVISGLFLAGMLVCTWQIRALSRRVASQRENPGRLTADAALSVVGACGVAIPGLVTSALGLLLLLPPTRAVARTLVGQAGRAALARVGGSAFTTATRFGAPESSQRIPGWGEVIDHRDDEFGKGTTPR